jgi:hypothetical protein
MNALYVIVTWVALGLIVPGLVFVQLPEEAGLTTEGWLSVAILFYCTTRLSWMAGEGKPRLLTFTFFLFIYVWIGLSATAQMAVNDFPWQRMHMPEDLLPGILEVWLAIAAFEAGLIWARLRPPSANASSLFSGLNLSISDRAAVWLSAVAIVLTLIGMKSWGFNHLFITRAEVDRVMFSGTMAESLLSRALLRTPSLVAFTVILYNALRRWPTFNQQRKQFYFVLALILGGFYFAANYPPAQTRFWLGAAILTPAFALPRWRKWLAPLWIIALAGGLTVVFPYLDLFRHAGSVSEAVEQLDTSETAVTKMIKKPDYDVFQVTLDGYVYGEQAGPTWGSNYAVAALFWFPRAYWPDKPYGSGQEVAKYFRRSFTNLSAPIWMEAYYAFGWFGIGLILMLYGRLCAWGEILYGRSLLPGAPDSLARLMVPYWAAFQMFIMRGDLLNATAYSAFGYAILLGTAILPRIWGRKPATMITMMNRR